MKCIKDKCRYHREKDFWISAMVCGLDDKTFYKDDIVECRILNKINELKSDINVLEEYIQFIKNKQ